MNPYAVYGVAAEHLLLHDTLPCLIGDSLLGRPYGEMDPLLEENVVKLEGPTSGQLMAELTRLGLGEEQSRCTNPPALPLPPFGAPPVRAQPRFASPPVYRPVAPPPEQSCQQVLANGAGVFPTGKRPGTVEQIASAPFSSLQAAPVRACPEDAVLKVVWGPGAKLGA